MNCEQKSGVFLNRSCERSATETCDTCKKEICETHLRLYKVFKYCIDCYWEAYLYAEEQNEEFYDNETDTPKDNDTTSSPTSSSDDGTFQGGFGGGGFGGGGAGGTWTEGDAQGFNETNTEGGLLDKDDTFYYS